MSNTTPTPAPAPMTADKEMAAWLHRTCTAKKVNKTYGCDNFHCVYCRAARYIGIDADHIVALTARVAELERERQYTCEQHRNEVRKGERCVWCELAAARGAFDLSESERQRLAGRINATEARKVEDGDVQDAVDWLRDRAECSSITLDPAPMGPIADLLTRLSAALKEAGQRASDHLRASEILNRHCVRLEARAQAAEATIDAAQGHFEFLIAMTQLADVNGKVEVRSTGQTKFASEPLATAMAREAFAALVEIRALQTKDTTP